MSGALALFPLRIHSALSVNPSQKQRQLCVLNSARAKVVIFEKLTALMAEP